MLSPGVLLGNRYRLDERIAGGGMGDVWRGTDEVLGRTVAVKILLPALVEEPGFAERFRGEARTMATINHPGVVDVYDYGSDQQIAFLVMEYVEGDALSRTLGRVGRLTPARTMALVAQAADALQAAHEKGIVHRDVKPGNLLVRPNGTLVLTDFGIARSAMVAQLTAAGSVLGTASYISPEQAAGATATSASDVYALGVVAYQCLSGHRPFEGDNPLAIAMMHVRDTPRPLPGDIPPLIRSIVERAMAKDPGARWPSASALAVAARQAAVAPSGPPHPATPPTGSGPVMSKPASAPPAAQTSGPAGTRMMPAYPSAATSGPPAQGPHPISAPPQGSGQHPGQGHHPGQRPPNGPISGPQAAPGSPVAGYSRGAASIPAARPAHPDPTYGYQQPHAASRPQPTSAANRPLLIILAIVLGILVVLCSGTIAYQAREKFGMESGLREQTGTSASQLTVSRDDIAKAPYRQVEGPRHPSGVPTT